MKATSAREGATEVLTHFARHHSLLSARCPLEIVGSAEGTLVAAVGVQTSSGCQDYPNTSWGKAG